MFEEIRIREAILYQDKETGLIFQRFKGGWIVLKDGSIFICIIGERYDEGKTLLPLHVFYEKHINSMHALVKECLALQSLYHLNHWLADHEGDKESHLKFFHDFKDMKRREDPKSKVHFSFHQPSIPSDFNLARQIWDSRFQQNALILKKGGILDIKREQANQEDSSQPGLAEKYGEIIMVAAIIADFDSLPFDPMAPKFEPRRPPSWMSA